jgi:hypothetical protein
VVAANNAVKGLNGLQLKEKHITAVINNRSDLIVVVKGDLKEAQDVILGKVEVGSDDQENLREERQDNIDKDKREQGQAEVRMFRGVRGEELGGELPDAVPEGGGVIR